MTRRRRESGVCRHCKGTFEITPSEQAKGGGVFCSLPCRRTFQAAQSPNYEKIGTRAVHRIVAAQKLGRDLLPGEVVHHIDGNKRNNDPENLDIYPSNAEHMRGHIQAGDIGFTHEQAVNAGRLSWAHRRRVQSS